MVAVDILSPSNADCQRGFSAMNNIITDSRNAMTTNNAEMQLLVGAVGPPCEQWNCNDHHSNQTIIFIFVLSVLGLSHYFILRPGNLLF